jgi:type I restriction enzyme S subunit
MKYRWPQTPLGEVLAERKEKPSDRDLASGNVQIIEKISFNNGQIQIRADGSTKTGMILARPGDLVVSGINAVKGAIAIYEDSATKPLAATIHYGAYIPNRDRVDVRFLWWMLRSHLFQDLLLEHVPGGIKTELKASRLLPIPVPLPPLNEQRRIVTRIEELSAQVHEARTLRHQAAEEAEALLLSHVGDIFTSLGHKHKVRDFGSFSPHVTSGPRNWAKHYEQNGLRFYRAQDVGPAGKVLDDSKVFIKPPPGEQGRTAMLQYGDLMLVITGATVGRVNVYRKGLEPGFVSQHVGICRLPQSEIDPEFALWGLRGPMGQEQLLGQRYGQGKPGLNLTNIRSLSLPIPGLAEQRRLVAEMAALQAELDALKGLQAETATELDALLPSVLDKAFRGEL